LRAHAPDELFVQILRLLITTELSNYTFKKNALDYTENLGTALDGLLVKFGLQSNRNNTMGIVWKEEVARLSLI